MSRALATAVRHRRPAMFCGLLIAANAAVWGWAMMTFCGRPVLLGTAFLAYTFGLRHAVDADHIAAIDNATRKLVEAKSEATAAGLFFSLGHATVVVLASIAAALTSVRLRSSLAGFKPAMGAIFTGFSALCLLGLAIANCVILVSAVGAATSRRRGESADPAAPAPPQGLLLGRLLRGAFRLVSRSWHMYPLGFLFGLGFDTATEIGVLGMSAAQAAHGLDLAAIMVFPALFTAGMALVDTFDAVLMAGAYRWAATEPLRKLYYNLAITTTSIAVAIGVGALELLGMLADGSRPATRFWASVAGLDKHFAALGAGIIAFFVVLWAVSVAVWRRRSTAESRPAGSCL